MSKPVREAGTRVLLLCTVFIISTCGLIYELIAGTLASYLLGDSVTQFSTIIGSYLFAMGVGSWLSGYIRGHLLRWFISVEILVGLIGGLSAATLFVLFEQAASFRVLLYAIVGVIGVLVGLEIPLLMRLLKDEYSFENLVSRIFTFDYIGSLLASIIFPLLLVPHLGLIRSAVLFGLLNVAVATFALFRLEAARPLRRSLSPAVILSAAALIACYIWAGRIQGFSESLAFHDKVIFSKSTPYQRIVLTRGREDIRLYLNGNLQFSSRDEYRYHEALVHPVLGGIRRRDSVLVLGGGDGLALREILKYPDVAHIDLVDLDPAMTAIFSREPILTRLNGRSFSHPKVRTLNMDAFQFVRKATQRYAAIIVDFPDPGNFSVGKLYSSAFYNSLRGLLRDDGALVIQSTSPFVARKSFWCVAHTLGSVGFNVVPYHAYVPSFGEWGYVLGTKAAAWKQNLRLPAGLRFITTSSMPEMLRFPPDMAELPTDTNRLNNASLVRYFEEEWSHYVNVQ